MPNQTVALSGPRRVVGRYALHGEIASGGMATVHLGRLIGPEGFARTVAIKQLHPHYAKDPDFVAMFLDEARLVARIRHPNVVPTLDVVQTDDDLLLVMEYVAGETLSHVTRHVQSRDEAIPMAIVAAIMSGVLHGLHAAHEARGDNGELLGVVHRDVSPQNVLVGTDGVARVLDFGVAKAVGRAGTTRDGQLKGKMAYMSVEQLYGRGVDRRTDIYAASVVLWETLTMQRLFKGENDPEVFGKVLAGCTTPPSAVVPTLDKSFDEVVMRGLSIDPEKRFPTARDMARQLERCVGIATPTDVSDWLEVHAADLLKGRAKRVSALESSSGVLLPPLPLPPTLGGGPSVSSEPADSSEPAEDQHTVVSDVRDTAIPPHLPTTDYPIDVDVAPQSSSSAPPAAPVARLAFPSLDLDPTLMAPLSAPGQPATPPHLEFRPPIPWRTWSAGAGGIGVLVVGLYFLLRTSPAPSAPSSIASASAPAASMVIVPPITRHADPAVAAPVAVPSATVDDTQSAPPAADSAEPAPQPPSTALATPPAKAPVRPVTAPQNAAVRPAGGDCNPPYYFDAAGKKHYKRQCG